MMAWFSWLYVFLFLSFLSTHVSSSFLSASPSCHHDDRSALLRFNKSFSIDDRTFSIPDTICSGTSPPTMSWESGTDCCAWNGVTCDTITGHVIGLDLYCGGLHGMIHFNSSLFQLPHLKTLNLSVNDFRGSKIPAEFGKFPHLLNLEIIDANFSGHIPPEISYLSKLQTIRLSGQQLRLNAFSFGRIATNLTDLRVLDLGGVDMSEVEPVSLVNLSSSSLTSLLIFDCGLQGNFPISIFHLPKLQQLRLDYNQNLTGSLPKYNWSSSLEELGLSRTKFLIDISYLTRNMKTLDALYLSNCSFVGSYQQLFGNLTNISDLDLSYSNIGGQIPFPYCPFQNLERLAYLNLAGNNFIGQVPNFCSPNKSTQITLSHNKSFGPELHSLYLSDNLLNGTIPNWLYSLPSLRSLFLQNNRFTGHIHEFQTTSLEGLDLRNNMLHGSIPVSVFQQVYLYALDLSSNYLSGFRSVHSNHSLAAPRILPNLEFLDLSDNLLNGTIPNWLYSLPSLGSLYLQNNRFTGHIHEFQTTSLEGLDLRNNMLHGSIPVSVFQQVYLYHLDLSSNYFSGFCSVHSNHSLAAPRILPNLESLSLSHNQIQGEVPKCLRNVGTDSLYFVNLSYNSLTNIERIPWRNLHYLDLRSNRITGEVPSSICNLRSLEVLDLANNTLNGKLPPCMGTLSGNLSVLDMRMNKLHGMIPATLFGKKSALRTLNFNGNQLEGLLPPSLLNCKNLQVLDIGNNMINGTFPHWLESLPLLQVLILRSNKFHGSVRNPTVRFPFRKLRILDLSGNDFNGNLPAKLFENLRAMMEINTTKGLVYMGDYYYHDSVFLEVKGNFIEMVKILTVFTTIDLSINNFEGEIPKSISKLKSLKGLNLSHNKLNGFIPSSLGNLSELESLDLSSNVLVGTIPQQLTDITSLAVLNLAENKLVGRIPRGKQFETFESNCYRENLDLCGFPLSKLCEAQQPLSAHFQQEGEYEHFQQEGEYELTNWLKWMIVSIGFGCGMVIGISIAYMVLSEKRIAQLMRSIGEEGLRKLLKRFKYKAR